MGFALGDYPFVTVERTQHKKLRHRFQSGKVVHVFSMQDAVEGNYRKGVINYMDEHKMKIIFYAQPMPPWIQDGKIGVELLFDERSFEEMEKALEQVGKATSNRLAELRDLLSGHSIPQFTPRPKIELVELNASQNQAVNQIVQSDDLVIVHGPPGTGKTTTIVAAVQELCKKERGILACAPSNAATDLLTEKLAEQGLNVVRIGNISRVDHELLDLTLDGRLSKHPDSKNIKKVRKQAEDCRRRARRYKRNFRQKERDERKELYQEARELASWAILLEDRLTEQIIDAADVITCTPVGSISRYLKKRRFNTVILDEAAQALEPSSWIPILKAKKVVLAGDPLQLSPTVRSIEAAQKGLSTTMIEHCMQHYPEATNLLTVQYRMNAMIMNFSNQQFYENQLEAHESVANHLLEVEQIHNQALEFIDTAGCGFEEVQNPETLSFSNPDEFTLLREHLAILTEAFPEDNPPSVGIISPYKEQVVFMKEELKHVHYSINTIDAFQGQERDVIYISLVRSNPKGVIGFLSDVRRMNVAMTRARKKLVIIGDSATIGNHPFYQQFLDFCDANGAYFSAWDYIQ